MTTTFVFIVIKRGVVNLIWLLLSPLCPKNIYIYIMITRLFRTLTPKNSKTKQNVKENCFYLFIYHVNKKKKKKSKSLSMASSRTCSLQFYIITDFSSTNYSSSLLWSNRNISENKIFFPFTNTKLALSSTIFWRNNDLIEWPWWSRHYSFNFPYLPRTICHVLATIRSDKLQHSKWTRSVN